MSEFEKLKQHDIVLDSKSKTVSFWDNYWYHYKWHTIIIGFFAFMLIFMLVQCMGGDGKKDAVIVYCGPKSFVANETEGIRETLNAVLPEDFDQDGERYVEFVRFLVYSPEQQEQDLLINGGDATINPVYNAQQIKAFDDFMMVGEASIYLLSPYAYERIKSRQNMRPVAQMFDTLPPLYDEYAVRLGDLPIYKQSPSLALLPEDTLLCLTVPYAIGSSSNEAIYQRSEQTFRAIVLWSAE